MPDERQQRQPQNEQERQLGAGMIAPARPARPAARSETRAPCSAPSHSGSARAPTDRRREGDRAPGRNRLAPPAAPFAELAEHRQQRGETLFTVMRAVELSTRPPLR